MSDSIRVVLTGASGFIGRSVLTALLCRGVDVIVLGRSRPSGYKGIFIPTDLCHPDKEIDLLAIKGSHLMHLAWYTEHGKYWSSVENAHWVAASHRLFEKFCSAGGRKIVGAGTCAEYEWSTSNCIEDITPLAPTSIYGMAKNLSRELLSEACQSKGVSWAWGRVFFPFGPGENRQRLMPSLIDVFKGERNPFPVSLESERDFLHVEDVANAFIHMLLSECQGPYNICSGSGTLLSDVINQVAGACGGDPKNIPPQKSIDLSPRVVGDNRRLKALGWVPHLTLLDTLTSKGSW
jgi:nucleoside-diphosphate-sugar epimerase